MRRIISCITGILCLSLSNAKVADLSLRFATYSNPQGLGYNGHCCDGRWGICQSQCDYYFSICVDKASSTSTDQCQYLKTTTGHYHNQNSVSFTNKILDVDNPVVISMDEVPETFSVKVEVYDKDRFGSDDYVDFIKFSFDTKTDAPRNFSLIKSSTGKHTTMTLGARLTCSEDQYGYLCDKYCKPAGNIRACDQDTGDAICSDEWRGVNCTEPGLTTITLPGPTMTASRPSSTITGRNHEVSTGLTTISLPAPTVTTSRPLVCPLGWQVTSLGCNCYLISRSKLTWLGARAYCKRAGADLLAINSRGEQQYFEGELRRQSPGLSRLGMWMGLNDRAREGRWMWNDNTRVGYTHWRIYEPSGAGLNNTEDCGAIFHRPDTWRGYWYATQCSERRNFICEMALKQTDGSEEGTDTEGSASGSGSGSGYI